MTELTPNGPRAGSSRLTPPLAIGLLAGIVVTQFTPVGEFVWNLIYRLGAPMAAAGIAAAVLIICACVGLSLAVYLTLRKVRRR